MQATSSELGLGLAIPTPGADPVTKHAIDPDPNDLDELDPNDLDLPIAIRKGTRTCTKHPLHLFLSYSNLSPKHKAFLTSLNTIFIPRTFFEAVGNEN